MSFLLRWINENLLKKKITKSNISELGQLDTNTTNTTNSANTTNTTNTTNISTETPKTEIICTKPSEEEIILLDEQNRNFNKWKPNNELVKRYNKFLNCIAELNRQKHSLEHKLIPRSKQIIKEYMQKSRSLNITDKIEASDVRKEMYVIEKKVLIAEESIKKLESMDSGIIDEWNNYLEEARDFLLNNNINSEITIDDILSNDGLYIMSKKYLDGYLTTINPDKCLKTISDIKHHFDIGNLKNTMNITLAEYEEKRKLLLDFSTVNSLNAIKEAPKLFLRDINNVPIEYDLNINNNPVELSDDKISKLSDDKNVEASNDKNLEVYSCEE